MEAFVKSFATYRTIKQVTVISSALALDSLDPDVSTVTVKGTTIGRVDVGNWLIVDGLVYRISAVKPQTDRTMLTLDFPLEVFNRSLEYSLQTASQTVGGFVADVIRANWIHGADLAYSIPYLVVSNSDTTRFAPPELDGSGCFALPDYIRLMRRSYRVTVRFTDEGSTLQCSIVKVAERLCQVSFEDGRSKLETVDYSATGAAKVTVLCDNDTGEKDADGNAIYQRSRSEWYLSNTGKISSSVPARRASGEWLTIQVKGTDDIEAKVVETFAKNKTSHKLEFWSELDLSVQDSCSFFVYGELLQSHISYKRKTSEDRRFYYKSGELATTATEKLRGVKR